MKSDKKAILSSFFWKILERVGVQSIQLLIQILLARLLLPRDYGVITLISIFLTMAVVLVQSGLNIALVQKKEPDEKDFSTVFWISILLSLGLYAIIYLLAPSIACFYGEYAITKVFRVLSIVLFFCAINSVQTAYLSKKLLFKKLFKCSLAATITSGILGIVMAYKGLGMWALVSYQIANSMLNCFIMWFLLKWYPTFVFDFARMKDLWQFGSKIMIAYLLDTIYREIQGLVLGKISDTTTLGYYNRGQQIPAMVTRCSNDTIKSVLLPILSESQYNLEELKTMMRKALSITAFIIFPIMAGLAMLAPIITEVLLTEKWLPSVPFARILCLAYFMEPLISVHTQAIHAVGRSDVFCKTVYIYVGISLVVLFISAQISVYAVAYGIVLVTIGQWFMYIFVTKKYLTYAFWDVMQDIAGSFFLTMGMVVILIVIDLFELNTFLKLAIEVLAGVVSYTVLAFLFKPKAFRYLMGMFKERRLYSNKSKGAAI